VRGVPFILNREGKEEKLVTWSYLELLSVVSCNLMLLCGVEGVNRSS